MRPGSCSTQFRSAPRLGNLWQTLPALARTIGSAQALARVTISLVDRGLHSTAAAPAATSHLPSPAHHRLLRRPALHRQQPPLQLQYLRHPPLLPVLQQQVSFNSLLRRPCNVFEANLLRYVHLGLQSSTRVRTADADWLESKAAAESHLSLATV